MTKTYYPGAVSVVSKANNYLTRWQDLMLQRNALTTDQISALASLISCIADFLAKWPKVPEQP